MARSKAKLRVKSGCLTCGQRKLKCDEQRPSWAGCSYSRRQCEWPAEADMYDRRHRLSSIEEDTSAPPDVMTHPSCFKSHHYQAHTLAKMYDLSIQHPRLNMTIRSDHEIALLNHYLDNFLQVLLLPDADPRFHTEYRSYIMLLALERESVKSAILACCASNKYMLTGCYNFQQLALRYYTQAVNLINTRLSSLDLSHDSPDDALLISVIYMYIYALWGPDASKDAPQHVVGAQKLLKLRCIDEKVPLDVTHPFDRMTAESILYQSFLLAMRHPFSLDFQIEPDFLSQTSQCLSSLTFFDVSEAANSPVMGAPLALYQLILDIINLYNSSDFQDIESRQKLKNKMRRWEELVDVDSDYRSLLLEKRECWDMIQFYVLAASLLLDWVLDSCDGCTIAETETSQYLFNSTSHGKFCDYQLQKPRWQSDYAFRLLRYRGRQEQWSRCYLSTWPLLIFGYAARQAEDIDIIRDTLCCSVQQIGYGEMDRIRKELELVWQTRNAGQ